MHFLARHAFACAAGAALVSAISLAPSAARAEGSVAPTGKGVAGGALLGAEVVDLTMAAVGVEKGWPYLVFGGVGAAAGGVGGFFVERAVSTSGHAEAPTYMLAGGLALVIPTVIASLNATSYHAPESDRTDVVPSQPATQPPAPQAPAAPGAPQAPAVGVKATLSQADAPRPARVAVAAPRVPVTVVDVHEGKLGMGVPAVEVRPVYSQREITMYGVDQKSEVRVPLFGATF